MPPQLPVPYLQGPGLDAAAADGAVDHLRRQAIFVDL